MNTFFNKIWAYMKLFRWLNLLIMAFTMIFFKYMIIENVYATAGIQSGVYNNYFVYIILSVLLIAAGAYVINDYFDIKIDQANKRRKRVLGIELPQRKAIMLHGILTTLGCLISVYVSIKIGYYKLSFITIIFATILYFYSLKYKRMFIIGNVVVALVTAFTLIYVWLFEFFALNAQGLMLPNSVNKFLMQALWIYVIFAFIITLIREIVKDIEDEKGDHEYGCRTIPIVIGIKSTKILLYSLISLTVIAIISVVFVIYPGDLNSFDYGLLVIAAMLLYTIFLLFKAKEKDQFTFIGTVIKIVMIAGVLTMQLVNISI